MPAGAWKTIKKPGKNKGYKAKGAGPVASVLVKPGKLIKATLKGPGVAPSLAVQPDAVTVVVDFGTQSYCATFGGTPAFKANKKLSAKNAPAPTSCPAPAE